MGTAALVIAILSLVIAVFSLGWQVAAWLLETGRVRVKLQHGVVGWNGIVVGDVHRDGRPRDLAPLRSQGAEGPEILAIKVTNVGRSHVTVTRYGTRAPKSKNELVPVADVMGPSLPHRLEPGESETWWMNMDGVRALVHASKVLAPRERRVDMFVETGLGRTLYTSRRIVIK
ncbi:MAG: phosphoribosylamine--glycine ligase [Streptosporangiales bacterium]|nr:phosphoribosylamine--glycine ligase [Streptosporangiales bacterium]